MSEAKWVMNVNKQEAFTAQFIGLNVGLPQVPPDSLITQKELIKQGLRGIFATEEQQHLVKKLNDKIAANSEALLRVDIT